MYRTETLTNQRFPKRLIVTLVLAAVLLTGRLTLAMHVYEHEAFEPGTPCELCEHARALDDLSEPSPSLLPSVSTGYVAAAHAITCQRFLRFCTFQPRAPPQPTS